VYDYRVPIEIGQARIEPGDILFGDVDGICVIPVSVEAEVFSLALEKARGEKLVKKDLEQGVSAVSAFARHGIM
jgi:regulator of RNase E activity RraA